MLPVNSKAAFELLVKVFEADHGPLGDGAPKVACLLGRDGLVGFPIDINASTGHSLRYYADIRWFWSVRSWRN